MITAQILFLCSLQTMKKLIEELRVCFAFGGFVQHHCEVVYGGDISRIKNKTHLWVMDKWVRQTSSLLIYCRAQSPVNIFLTVSASWLHSWVDTTRGMGLGRKIDGNTMQFQQPGHSHSSLLDCWTHLHSSFLSLSLGSLLQREKETLWLEMKTSQKPERTKSKIPGDGSSAVTDRR